MNWNAIAGIAAAVSALIALVGVAVAYFAFKKTNESVRLALSADLVTKLDDKFNGAEMKECRRVAAEVLLMSRNLGEAEDVLDFFETIGLLVRLEALNVEMVHNTFFHWANLYWWASRAHVESRRQQATKNLWVDFELLHQRIARIERLKDSDSKDLNLAPETLREYLEQEKALR